MFKKFALVGVAVLFLGSVSACGKTVDQIKKAAHELIEVVGGVYEDTLDNIDSVKEILKDEEDSE